MAAFGCGSRCGHRAARSLERLGGRSSIEGEMQWWVLVLLVLALKVPMAALMLWIPLRSDQAMDMREEDDRLAQSGPEAGSDDEGGSKTLPQEPRGGPHPRRPLAPVGPRTRGPHGSAPPPSPPRVRHRRTPRPATVTTHR